MGNTGYLHGKYRVYTWEIHGIYKGNIWYIHGENMLSTWETEGIYTRDIWDPYNFPWKSHMGPTLNPFTFLVWVPYGVPIWDPY